MVTTGLYVTPCTQITALNTVGVLQLKETERAGVLEWGKPVTVLHLCFWLILLPRTGPGFSAWQTGLHTPILTTLSGKREHFLTTKPLLCSLLHPLYVRFVPKTQSWWNLLRDFSWAAKEANKLLSTCLWAMHFPTAVFIMVARVLERPRVFLDCVKTTTSVFPSLFFNCF